MKPRDRAQTPFCYLVKDAHSFNLSRIAAQLAQLVLSKQEFLRYLIIICAREISYNVDIVLT